MSDPAYKRKRVYASFFDGDGDASDPDTVTIRVTEPAGRSTLYEYGEGQDIIRGTVGVYYVEIALTSPGLWRFIAIGYGVGGQNTSDETSLMADRSLFPTGQR